MLRPCKLLCRWMTRALNSPLGGPLVVLLTAGELAVFPGLPVALAIWKPALFVQIAAGAAGAIYAVALIRARRR